MHPNFETFLLKRRIERCKHILKAVNHERVGAGKKPDKKHKDNNPTVERKPMPDMPTHAMQLGDDAYPHGNR